MLRAAPRRRAPTRRTSLSERQFQVDVSPVASVDSSWIVVSYDWMATCVEGEAMSMSEQRVGTASLSKVDGYTERGALMSSVRAVEDPRTSRFDALRLYNPISKATCPMITTSYWSSYLRRIFTDDLSSINALQASVPIRRKCSEALHSNIQGDVSADGFELLPSPSSMSDAWFVSI